MTLGLAACKGIDDNGDNNTDNPPQEETTTYTVTFKQTGVEDVVRTVNAGEALTDVPAPQEKIGYTVVWNTQDFSSVTQDLTVEAVATANTYKITYDAGDGIVTSTEQDVVFDSTPTHPTPTYSGYEFIGWYRNGLAVSGKWTIAENVTLVAGWEKIPTYTVTFVQAGQQNKVYENVERGSEFTSIPECVEKKGYTVKWKDTDLAKLANVTGNVTVNAEENPNTYKITYDAGDGVVTPTYQDVLYDSTPTHPTPTLDKHEFTGWYYKGVAVSGKWAIAEEVTLTAGWIEEKELFTVTFVQAGQKDKVFENVLEGSAFTNIPECVEKTGYTVNWKDTDLAKLANVTGNVTVNAEENPNTYKVNYDAGDGVVTPTYQDVLYDSTPTHPTPTLDRYEFTGWYYQGVAVSGKWTIAEEVTLVAGWAKKPTYSVTFVQAGQENVVFEDILEGSAFTNIPTCVAKKGYTVEWDEVALAKLANVTDNVVVNAVERIKTYTVTLDMNGGTAETKDFTITYGEEYTLPTPSKTEYVFDYWTHNGQKVGISGVWDIDVEGTEVTLVAKWYSEWSDNF